MLIFSFVLFPAVLASYLLLKKQNYLVAVFSLTCALLVAFIRGFFFFPESFISLSILECSLRFFFPMALIPAVFFTLFMFFSKDELNIKIDSVLLFFLTFFMVTVPFETIRNFSTFNFYVCFLRPVVYLTFVFAAGGATKTMLASFSKNNKKIGFLEILILLAEISACCFLDTTYYLSLNSFFSISIAVVVILLFVFAALKQNGIAINSFHRPSSQTPQSQNSAEQAPD